MTPPGQPNQRLRAVASGVVLAVAALLLAGCASHGPRAAPPDATRPVRPANHPPNPRTTNHPPTPRTTIRRVPLPEAPAGSSLIATTHGTIPRYPNPGAPSDGTIPVTWHGGQSALPVLNERPGWLQVRLATRPNESMAWVRQADVTLSSTPYRIVVNLTTMHLQLLQDNKVVLDAPAGIGTPTDPTPTGQYFVALFTAPPSSGYGPFVMVTSAHSNTITDWEDSGDALIAIHGPLRADSQIGTTGAAISHGCVRLHIPDLTRLRAVPAGTPITITT